jgi:hypothetical protein
LISAPSVFIQQCEIAQSHFENSSHEPSQELLRQVLPCSS